MDKVDLVNPIPYSKLNVLFWTMYDVANTIFSMGIVSLTIIHYGEILGMQNGFDFGASHFIASSAITISTLIVAIFLPVWGAYADSAGQRKPFVVLMAAICILFTGAVFLFQDFLIALSLFVIANITYQWGNLFYDAMIPHISPPNITGAVSSFGVALGYAGSLVALALNIWAAATFGTPTPSETLQNLVPKSPQINAGHLRYMFPLSALAFLLLGLPFLLTKERTTPHQKSLKEITRESFNEVIETTKKVLKYPDMLKFILAWLILSDAVNTVIFYMKDVAVNALYFKESEATILLGVGVIAAIILTLPIGPIADKKGPKVAFYLVGTGWIVSTIVFILSGLLIPKEFVFLAAIIIGMSLGGTWVVQRQMVIELSPPEDITQYFAYSKFTGKLSAAIGPILFSGVLNLGLRVLGFDTPNAYRLAIFSLVIFFVLGFIVFYTITDYHKDYLSGKRAPYK